MYQRKYVVGQVKTQLPVFATVFVVESKLGFVVEVGSQVLH